MKSMQEEQTVNSQIMHQKQNGNKSNKRIAWILVLGSSSMNTIYCNKALSINAPNQYSFQIPIFSPATYNLQQTMIGTMHLSIHCQYLYHFNSNSTRFELWVVNRKLWAESRMHLLSQLKQSIERFRFIRFFKHFICRWNGLLVRFFKLESFEVFQALSIQFCARIQYTF